MVNRTRGIRWWPALVLVFGSASAAADVRELKWEELIPQTAVLEPSPGPGGGSWIEESFDDSFMSSSHATSVVEELDGIQARIPGFMVPLELADNGKIKEFLLVPYFGACIHFPPPPPNQIVYVVLDEPIEVEDTWSPVWAVGELTTKTYGSEIGSAGYTMMATTVENYEQ